LQARSDTPPDKSSAKLKLILANQGSEKQAATPANYKLETKSECFCCINKCECEKEETIDNMQTSPIEGKANYCNI
jgi:hypothetical protein